MILDEFKGQTTDAVLSLSGQNDIEYVLVPPNCTDPLQSLDVRINKPVKISFVRSLQIDILRKLWLRRTVTMQPSQWT